MGKTIIRSILHKRPPLDICRCRCALPDLFNDTWRVQSVHHATLINASIPPGQSTPYASCRLNSLTDPRLNQYGNRSTTGDWNGGNMSHDTAQRHQNGYGGTEACSRYVYDESVYSATISTEVNCVDSKSSQADLYSVSGKFVCRTLSRTNTTQQ